MGAGLSFFLGNFAHLLSLLLSPFLDIKPAKLLPVPVENIVSSWVSRSGRQRQRYDRGCRQVVGCIPYRYKRTGESDGSCIEDIQVLVVSAQNGHGMLFPKGGWEIDESMEEAALRETKEEAGVTGNLEHKLGMWRYMSKRGVIMHEGFMFPLLVQEQLEQWPEKKIRERRWVSVDEAKEICPHRWMREALDELVRRQTNLLQQQQQQQQGRDLGNN